MTASSNTLACTGLILSGLTLGAWSGTQLANNPELDTPPNPFGINRSPYGEVLAMAMQGAIDTDFHLAIFGINPDAHEHHDHAPGAGSTDELPTASGNLLQSTIAAMRDGHQQRTNPLPPNPALKFHLRREAEDKLRFAYQLDPSHYANYNALHFFLVEGITTRPELVPTAKNLARNTIDYCMEQKGDPRPALTAAAASTNILMLMFNDYHFGEKNYSSSDMRRCLNQLDKCMARYQSIAAEWDANGTWELLSPQRIMECQQRLKFIQVIRDTAEKTLQRIEKEQK